MGFDARDFKSPLKLIPALWPDVRMYRKQKLIIESVWENDRTYVPAGHKLGKDYITGLILPCFFLTRTPCRIVTTSVDASQLTAVLWGEMRRHIMGSRYPLLHEQGGPLIVNHMQVRKVVDGKIDALSYIIGRVAQKGEGLSGHHLARGPNGEPKTLGVCDEGSGIEAEVFDRMSEWAHRFLCIGNPYECQNDFKWAVKGKPGTPNKGGDVPRSNGRSGYARKIIRIKAEDSPNVQLGMAEVAAGKEPSGRELIPGVIGYDEYMYKRTNWDEIKQCAGLDADFWEGAEVLMFPPAWLNAAERKAEELRGKRRVGRGMGVDSAQGGDKTAWCVVDEFGVVALKARKTPDTDVIAGETLALMREYDVPPENICFDNGGGGKEHADRLRKMGYPVRTVAFGTPLSLELRTGRNPLTLRKDTKEERYAYKNRRAQMYGELRQRFNPINGGFALPREFEAIRHQLTPIPLRYDGEGRMELLPKHPDPDDKDKPCLTKLIGHSPDEADALVLANHGMSHKAHRSVAGVG